MAGGLRASCDTAGGGGGTAATDDRPDGACLPAAPSSPSKCRTTRGPIAPHPRRRRHHACETAAPRAMGHDLLPPAALLLLLLRFLFLLLLLLLHLLLFLFVLCGGSRRWAASKSIGPPSNDAVPPHRRRRECGRAIGRGRGLPPSLPFASLLPPLSPTAGTLDVSLHLPSKAFPMGLVHAVGFLGGLLAFHTRHPTLAAFHPILVLFCVAFVPILTLGSRRRPSPTAVPVFLLLFLLA